jgi:hypothetical protein
MVSGQWNRQTDCAPIIVAGGDKDWLSIAYKQCIMKTIDRPYDSPIGKQNL